VPRLAAHNTSPQVHPPETTHRADHRWWSPAAESPADVWNLSQADDKPKL